MNSYQNILRSKFERFLLGVLAVVFFSGGVLWGQFYASQDGHLLDANPRVGSMGLNSPVRFDSLMPRVNLYITGNISGGGRFQGVVPYSSGYEFQGSMGSSTLSDFRRDSLGVGDLSTTIHQPQMYIDPSRSITFNQGGSIYQSAVRPYQGLSGFGSSVYPGGPSAGGGSSMHPLSGMEPMEPLRISSASTPLIDTRVNLFSETKVPVGLGKLPAEGVDIPAGQMGTQPMAGQLLLEGLELPEESMEQNPVMEESFPFGQKEPEEPGMTEGQGAEGTASGTFYPEEITKGVSAPELLGGSKEEEGESSEAGLSKASLKGVDLEAIYQRNYQIYMSRGYGALREEKYYLAENFFRTAQLYDVGKYSSLLGRCYSLLGAGEYMSAAFFLKQAIELEPDLAAAVPGDLQPLFDEKTLQSRLDELEHWQKQTKQPMLAFLKGYVLYLHGQTEAACEAFSELRESEPEAKVVVLLMERICPDAGK